MTFVTHGICVTWSMGVCHFFKLFMVYFGGFSGDVTFGDD